MLHLGMLVGVVTSIQLISVSGKPPWKSVGQCGTGLACGPECQLLCLTQHNYYRSLHNLPSLRCDPDLAESAQAWTDMQAQKGHLKRSPWRSLGTLAESISWKQWGWQGMADTRAAVPSAVRSWYSEKKGSIVNRTSVPEHFQTIVRPDVSRLGCGIHVIPGDGTYVTSHYSTESGENSFNDLIKTSAPRDPEPACRIKSGQREKCGDIRSPFVTPDTCLNAGCCYDDIFNDEPDVLWYSNEGSTWCYKNKNDAKQTHGNTTEKAFNTGTSQVTASDKADDLKVQAQDDNGEPKGFYKDCLDRHNELRAKHGVPPLKWSSKLAANALETAKMNAKIGDMKHDPDNKDEGENIAFFGPPQPKCEGPKTGNCFQCREVVDDWYSEIKDYDFAEGKSKTGFTVLHFTQVVWAKTTEMGMATAVGNNKLFSVARYSEKGNMLPEENFVKNVPPLGTEPSAQPPSPQTSSPQGSVGPTSISLTSTGSLPTMGGNNNQGSVPTQQPSAGGSIGSPASIGSPSPPPGKGGAGVSVGSPAPIVNPVPRPTASSGVSIGSPAPIGGPSPTPDTSGGPEGKDCFGTSCYAFHAEGESWTKNREECKKNGGDLVVMETEEEWSYINNKIQELTNEFNNEWHIGLKKEGSTWKWVNGQALSIKHWQSYQPSGDGPYAIMAKNYPLWTRGGFNDLPDWLNKGYICETAKGHAGEDCYGGSCYTFNSQGESWSKNREKCKKTGSDLVAMETEGEWNYINNKIQELSNPFDDEWHIGLKKEESTWKWVNGKMLGIKHWQRYQPSGDGPYVIMAKNYPPGTLGGFNDLPDWMNKGYICETADGKSPSPTNVGSNPSPTSQPSVTGATTAATSTTTATNTTTEGTGTTGEPKGFYKDCLDRHNELRAKHGVPPLKWSSKLAANALKTAKMNAKIGNMKHDPDNKDEGENIAFFGPPQPKCEGPKTGNCFQCREVVDDWYSEIKDYDFAEGKSKTGFTVLHFTQVVWAKTTEMGMATAVGNNKLFSVARYSEKGNMLPEENFVKNVPPLV